MSNIKLTSISKNKTNPELVSILQELLESAECGDLVALIFIDKYLNNDCRGGCAGTVDRKMLGAMDEVKVEILMQSRESEMPID